MSCVCVQVHVYQMVHMNVPVEHIALPTLEHVCTFEGTRHKFTICVVTHLFFYFYFFYTHTPLQF